jgi:DNA-directed RNA polymerase subunit RPC12/RpoP
MATFVVCSRCSKTLEIAGIDQLPEKWQRAGSALLCPRCASAGEVEEIGDVLDEEVIYPSAADDTLDEDFCEICTGPCQGH